MTNKKHINVRYDDQQADKIFQDDDSTPFKKMENLKILASTERKAFGVFEKDGSSTSNPKWFESLQQQLMNLGSPNINKNSSNQKS